MDADTEGGPHVPFRILSVDGGGIRGLIPALVIADLERRLQERAGADARAGDYFHMFAGTSTGGLIALSLTAPGPDPGRPRVSGSELASLYVEDGPRIFSRTLGQRLRSLWGLIRPKFPAGPLEEAVRRRIGDATLAEAIREVIITSYDMTGRQPYFFKRWRAREQLRLGRADGEADRNTPIVDAALATSAAPTYFPSHGIADGALIDGGVFAANPVVAAVVEALKRTENPRRLEIEDLLVVSLGTGLHEQGYEQSRVSRWGKIGWVLPHRDDPPILGAVLDGASDGADHWAHMLLNHEPGAAAPSPAATGRGPRYFRLQVPLDESIALDDATPEALTEKLPAAAAKLISANEEVLDAIVARLLAAGPIAPEPPPPGP